MNLRLLLPTFLACSLASVGAETLLTGDLEGSSVDYRHHQTVSTYPAPTFYYHERQSFTYSEKATLKQSVFVVIARLSDQPIAIMRIEWIENPSGKQRLFGKKSKDKPLRLSIYYSNGAYRSMLLHLDASDRLKEDLVRCYLEPLCLD